MNVEFLSKFGKDLDKISSNLLKDKIRKTIEKVKQANSINEIHGIKKLKGDNISYRIRIGDYRIGFFYEKGVIQFARIVHRKDIYRVFP